MRIVCNKLTQELSIKVVMNAALPIERLCVSWFLIIEITLPTKFRRIYRSGEIAVPLQTFGLHTVIENILSSAADNNECTWLALRTWAPCCPPPTKARWRQIMAKRRSPTRNSNVRNAMQMLIGTESSSQFSSKSTTIWQTALPECTTDNSYLLTYRRLKNATSPNDPKRSFSSWNSMYKRLFSDYCAFARSVLLSRDFWLRRILIYIWSIQFEKSMR